MKSKIILETSPLVAFIDKSDNLVYKLYQLTYNEVKIIDPKFELTKARIHSN